ncbi:MAG: hypothetical protein U0794_16950 [Isosphaeraceae bacterium]
MDQLKEILRQAIKYRFWIAVGISALLPMIAYFVGSGPIKAKAAAETNTIQSADKEVKQYASGTIPNAQYKPIVAEKTEILTKDVDNTWRKLYARQAPLLTWPEGVQDRFMKWGPKWPENVDSSAVQLAIIEYVQASPKFVTEVYKTLKAFDPVTGEGVVAAPPETELLHPPTFTIEKPPSLGKVWQAQQRLWVQRALLDVVSQVNKDAKDWDGAIIKQVNLINVGSPTAQDQRSLANGETAEKAEDIVDPSKPVEDTSAGATPDMGAAGMMAPTGMASGYAAMMGGMGGMGAAGPTEDVYFIKTESTQFKIMPVQLSVLIDQNRIQDLLIALENSPMNIQVMDFEMARPQSRVTKPEKGNAMNFGMYGGMGMMDMMAGGMMKGMGMAGMSGFGGNYGRSMGRMMDMGMAAGMGPGGYGMMGGGAADKKGVDKRSENLAQKRREMEKAVKSIVTNSLHDPYVNIVEVTLYGQARFFNPPPSETPAESTGAEASPGEAAPKDEAAKGEEPAKKEDAPKAEEPAAKKEDAPKAEEPAAKKEDAPKAEEPAAKKEESAKKEDTPKAEEPAAKKEEAPKPEAPATKEAPKAAATSSARSRWDAMQAFGRC